jgi:hypothetical protein
MRTLSWLVFFVGLALLTRVAATLVHMATVMAPFGGIPWSWDLLRINPVPVAEALSGALLAVAGITLLMAGRARSSALPEPAEPL